MVEQQSKVKIRVFGSFQFTIDDRPLKGRTPKDLTFLAYLILKHEAPVERTNVAMKFWGTDSRGEEQEESFAREYLTKALYQLGKGMGDQSRRLQKPDPQHLQFDVTDADLDLLQWETAIASGSPVALESVAHLLTTTTLLEDWNAPWVLEARDRLRADYMQALNIAALRARDHGEWLEADRCIRLMFAIDPVYDECWLRWLELLCERRRFTKMLRVYDEYLDYCGRHQQPVGKQARERFQLLRDRAQEFSASMANGNLPNPLSRYISRTADETAICELVCSNRLITLIGTGGVGKTRLAITVADQMRDDFYDRVWFVDLSDVDDAEAVWSRTAHALQLKESQGRSYQAVICESLHTKEMLLILDNCEHLIDACADLANQILLACPAVKIVATSRQALEITGEAVWHLPSLDFPEESEQPSPDRLAEFSAVRLLIDRASQPQRPFSIDAENAAAVARICRSLDGIPLAIELAAVQIHAKFRSAVDTAASLDDALSFLTVGSRIAPARHRTVRAVIEWSYRLLSETEKRVFQHLGVFVGGFTSEAVRDICADLPLMDAGIESVLTSLRGKSLVHSKTTVAGNRYFLLQTIRQFALERLESAGSEAAATTRLCHLTYYGSLANRAAMFFSGTDQAVWLDQLDIEHDNLRAALVYALSLDDFAIGLRLANDLAWFWYTRGYHRQGLEFLERCLARASAEPGETLLPLIHWAGNICYAQNDYIHAETLHRQGLQIRLAIGGQRRIAVGKASLANALMGHRNFAESSVLFEESLAVFRELRDERNIPVILTNLGKIAYAQGIFEKARSLHAESLAQFRNLNDRANVSLALNNLAGATIQLGQWDDARRLLEECLCLCADLGIKHRFLHCLTNFILLAICEQDYELAVLLHGFEQEFRQRIEHTLESEVLTKYMADLNRARTAVGERAYHDLAAKGAAMSEQEILAKLTHG